MVLLRWFVSQNAVAYMARMQMAMNEPTNEPTFFTPSNGPTMATSSSTANAMDKRCRQQNISTTIASLRTLVHSLVTVAFGVSLGSV